MGKSFGRVPRSLWMVIARLAEAPSLQSFLFYDKKKLLKYPVYAGNVNYLNATMGFLFLFLKLESMEVLGIT